MSNTLEGIRVADFTQIMAGSSGSMFLADLGAEVIKVENCDGGDAARASQPTLFETVNRNKRSLAVDLSTSAGVLVARRLVDTCDVVVQGFRPGALARKGLGADELRRDDPRLIYASLSGFGTSGPGSNRRGIDMLVQVESGMAKVMGTVNQRLGLIDAATGIVIGQAVLAALFKRERQGIGETIEVSLYDVALWLQMLPIAEFSATRLPPPPPEEFELRIPTMGMFDTSDGPVFISVLQQRDWLIFCDLIGEPQLVTDPRFADRELRGRHGAELRTLLRGAIGRTSTRKLLDCAERDGLMISELKDYDNVFADPQTSVNRSFQMVTTADGTALTQVRAPYRFLGPESGMPSSFRRAPRLGEHTRDVLGQLGYSRDAISGLIQDGVVREP